MRRFTGIAFVKVSDATVKGARANPSIDLRSSRAHNAALRRSPLRLAVDVDLALLSQVNKWGVIKKIITDRESIDDSTKTVVSDTAAEPVSSWATVSYPLRVPLLPTSVSVEDGNVSWKQRSSLYSPFFLSFETVTLFLGTTG